MFLRVHHRHIGGGARRLDDRQRGHGRDRCARPGALGAGPLGGAATARAVVHMPYELAAQGGGEQHSVVAGEPADRGAVALVDDREGGPRPFHFAGGCGQELPGRRGFQPEDGGDRARGEAVADRELQRLALFGVVPAASGQASWASSRRCASADAGLSMGTAEDRGTAGGADADAADRSAEDVGGAEGAAGAADAGFVACAPPGARRPARAPGTAVVRWSSCALAGCLRACGPSGLRCARRPCFCSPSLRRHIHLARAYSQVLRSSSPVGHRPFCRSASASTPPSVSVAASWSQSTERQYVNRPSRCGS